MREEFDGSKQGRKTRKSLYECKKCKVHKEKSREKNAKSIRQCLGKWAGKNHST